MQTGSGRAPLIIAIVAALITYAAFGNQTPFGFLHRLGHHHITINTDKTADAAEQARQDAEDRAQEAADRAQEQADRKQELRDQADELKRQAQELAQQAKELAQAGTEKAVAAIPAIPAVPAPPAPPAPVAAPAAPGDEEVLTLDPFDSVKIENATATITIADQQSVSISGNIGHAGAKVRDGKLTVSGPGATVVITVPHLKALQVDGFGTVSLKGLRDPIAIKANGAIQLSANGIVDSAELVMNGPSRFDFAKLQAKNLTIQLNGVGDADVYATDNLVADIKGVGHVRYRGDPHLITKTSGPGTIQHLSTNQG